MPAVQPSDANGSGRGRRGRRVGSTLSEINVVPLVDVMLVLLIIFMVTAPMIQRGVEVNLPVAKQASTIEGQRFFITVPANYARDGRVFLGDESIRIDVLPERIRQRFETSSDKQVYLRGDGAVQYRDLVDVFSRLKEAGVEKVGLVTEPPKRR